MYKFPETAIPAICVKRPSSTIKSPYVADIKFPDDEKIYLAHSPALGLGPYIKQNAELLVIKNHNTNSKTDFLIKAALDLESNEYVGATPLDANRLFKFLYTENIIINDFPKGNLKSEVTYGDSRFDFSITEDKIVNFIEVKCVPIKNKSNNGYFPDGYRKKKTDTISPRAVKHINELSTLGNNGHIVFMVLRSDCKSFEPNREDPLFCETLYNAIYQGVNIHIYNFKITNEGYQYTGKLKLSDTC